MKKEHFEILLENMTDKIDLVLEGHSALNKKIDNVSQEVKELRTEFVDLREDNEIAHKNLRKEVTELRQENKAAHVAINKKLDTREKETSALKRRVTRLEAARA